MPEPLFYSPFSPLYLFTMAALFSCFPLSGISLSSFQSSSVFYYYVLLGVHLSDTFIVAFHSPLPCTGICPFGRAVHSPLALGRLGIVSYDGFFFALVRAIFVLPLAFFLLKPLMAGI